MLIINADDWGGTCTATDNSLECYLRGRITSASAMVFMHDSERAAELARSAGLSTGLHLNFTDELARSAPLELQKRLEHIASFLRASNYRSLVYNPLLSAAFEYVYEAQHAEYVRLYGSEPNHIDGHHHMHLCMNVLASRIIPAGYRVRASFTFFKDEKSLPNRLYRQALNAVLRRRYVCPERFHSIEPIARHDRLARIVEQAKTKSVELMVHPSREAEFRLLMSDEFASLLLRVRTATYSDLER
jgi:predicted glycoside hydrolase/deacetylase ChbG (UPF0249 family)